MKRTIAHITFLTLFVLGCKAQHIIPVEEGYKYVNSEEGIMGNHNYVYLKDINNLLSKFTGTWKGNYNGNIIEVVINKKTVDDGELKEDLLLMRYKITEANGAVLENTLTLPDSSPFVLKNGYVSKTGSYVFNYIGRDSECGQNGNLHFIILKNSNSLKAKMFLSVRGETTDNCTLEKGKQVLPIELIDLNKH